MMMQDQINLTPKKPSAVAERARPKTVLGKTLSIILGISGLVIVLGIIAGGALLASHVWNPGWNPFKQQSNTDKIIREKIMEKIKK